MTRTIFVFITSKALNSQIQKQLPPTLSEVFQQSGNKQSYKTATTSTRLNYSYKTGSYSDSANQLSLRQLTNSFPKLISVRISVYFGISTSPSNPFSFLNVSSFSGLVMISATCSCVPQCISFTLPSLVKSLK